MRPSPAPPILVGVSNPATRARLIDLAALLAARDAAPVLATRVVTVPRQMQLSAARASGAVRAASDDLRLALDDLAAHGVSAEGVVEVARTVEDGLAAAVASRGAGLVLVGWSERGAADTDHEEAFDRLMHRVSRAFAGDLVVAKFRSAARERVLVPVAPSDHMALVARVAGALADAGAELRFVHVADPVDDRAAARAAARALLAAHGLADRGPLEVLAADDVAATITACATDVDVVVAGATHHNLFTEPFTRKVDSLAEDADCTVLLARAARGG